MPTFDGVPLDELYAEAYLAKFGVSLEAFLADPAMWLRLTGEKGYESEHRIWAR